MAKKKAKRAARKPSADLVGKSDTKTAGKPKKLRKPRRKYGPQAARRNAKGELFWQAPFLARLRSHNQIGLAAEEVGIHRRSVYYLAKEDKEFRRSMSEARRLYYEDNISKLEGELVRRALDSSVRRKDTRALLAALRRFDPDHYDRPKNQNVNLGGQPGNQLPASPTSEHRISVVRIIDINSHADAELFRRIQRERQEINEVIDETPPASIGSNEPTNGKHTGNGKPAANGKASRE